MLQALSGQFAVNGVGRKVGFQVIQPIQGFGYTAMKSSLHDAEKAGYATQK
jgi:hypothetical protein